MPKTEMEKNSTESEEQNRKSKEIPIISVPVTGLRIAIEAGVLICHFMNFVNIAGTETISEGISLTLLTLCITTVSTLIQFQDEARWQHAGSIAFNIPIVAFSFIAAFIVASSFTPELIPIIQNKLFAVIVSGAVTVRQLLHVKMLFDYFRGFKNKKGV